MSDQSALSRRESRVVRIALLTTGLLVLLLSAYMVAKFLHHDFKDAEVWYDAGRRVLNGQTLVNLPHYRYPPTLAVLVSPFCALGFALFYFLWYVMNLWFFELSGRAARAICLRAGASAPLHYHWLPLLLVAVYAIDNLILGQTNILIMLLVYWSFLEDSRGRQWESGLPLGAAIAIKAFPAPLLAYFLYRRRLRVVAGTLLSCAFFLLVVPGPVRGFGRNFSEVADWGRRVVMPYLSEGRAGDWGQHSVDFGNQSLSAVARRYLTRVDAYVAARRRGSPMYVNLASLTERQVNVILLALFLGLATAFVAACGWRRPEDKSRLAVEYSLAVIATLLVSALAWTYFFVMLLLPVAAAVMLLGERERLRTLSVWALRVAVWALVMATALLVSPYARALGSLCWAALVLFAALALAGRDRRRVGAGAVDRH